MSLVYGWWVGKVKDLVRETCERLITRVRDTETETETEIQSHRFREMGMDRETGQRLGGRESALWFPLAPRALAQSCTLTHPHPSLLSLVATVTGRLNMQQRRLGLQTWPVSMDTKEKGEPHLLTQVVGPQAAFPNSDPPPRREGRREGLSIYHSFILPTPWPAGMGLDHGEGDWRVRETWGCLDPRRF